MMDVVKLSEMKITSLPTGCFAFTYISIAMFRDSDTATYFDVSEKPVLYTA